MSRRFKIFSNANALIIDKVGKNKSRSIQFTGAACLGNLFVGLGKLVIGIISLSFFTCVSAFYTFGMLLAKACALKGLIGKGTQEKQCRYYKISGVILIISSILYVIYSTRLLWHPIVSHYDIYTGIGIAAFTFIELGLNIRGVIAESSNHTLLFHAIKMINLASSLICLVLTQTAILSFTNNQIQGYDTSAANGLMGILMGAAATLIGLIMLLRIRKIIPKQDES